MILWCRNLRKFICGAGLKSFQIYPGMVLLDGAHNPHAAQELAAYIDHAVRPQAVRWVVALSLGKDAKGILKQLLRDKDLAEVLSTKMDGKILQAWHIFEKSTNVVLQHISYRYTRLQDGIKTDFFLSISELDYLMSFRTLDRIFFRLPPYLHSHVVISMIQVWKSIFEACPTQDMFTAVSFSKVKGMPWVCPEAPAELIKVASELRPSVSAKAANHFEEALQEDADAVVKPQIVICGSLYLVADVISSISKPARGLK